MFNILIVDDEPHVIRVMKLALERSGHRVDIAPNGAAALDKIARAHPDVLITDIQMPRMNGQELCIEIAARWPERQFHIFVATSRAESEHRNWTRDLQDLTFLEKPVSIRHLQGRIDALHSGEAGIGQEAG